MGLVFGFFQFGGVLYWIALLQAAESLSFLAWFVLVFYLSLYYSVFGWIYCFLVSRLKLTGVWMAPFVWVALEYLRGSRPWGGFCWAEIGYTQAPYPSILVFTSLAGIYGLTFLMVWFNASLAHGFEVKHRFRWVYFILPLVILFSIWIWGTMVIETTPVRKQGTAALLQPSVDQSVKWSKAYEMSIYNKMEKLVKKATILKPDVIVWPETAAPDYLLMSPKILKRVKKIIARSKIPQLVGCLDAQRYLDRTIHYYNAAVYFSSKGSMGGIYHKRHLVPFGEFVPFQKYISFLGPVVGDLGNFDFGKTYQVFKTDKFSFSPMICYEVIFPADVQSALSNNADALVNISNDAWYGRTASAYQHAMMAVVRSAEERKPLLRAANTGISLTTDPFGRVMSSTELFDEKVLTADVFLASSGPTLFSQMGNWFPWFCLVVTILFIFSAFFKNKPIVTNSQNSSGLVVNLMGNDLNVS